MEKTVFYKTKEGRLETCNIDVAEYAMIPINEYNGLHKALRMVREKNIPLIKKTDKDEHGYVLKAAENMRYEYQKEETAWLITQQTPYSIDISLSEVNPMILCDLKQFYNFKRFSFSDPVYGKGVYAGSDYVKINDYIRRGHRFQGSEKDNKLYEILKSRFDADIPTVFEVKKIRKNYGEGVWEVSYWSTKAL